MRGILTKYPQILRFVKYPKIISCHIPKTAGTSFLQSLELEYGRVAYYYDWGNIPLKSLISPVIHGHFNPKSLFYTFPNSFKIIWFREPVERIISYYFFWKFANLNTNDKTYIRFKYENPTLLEFAKWPEIKFELSKKYLKGIDLNEFDFIGLQETYDKDIIKLTKKLNWSKNHIQLNPKNYSKKKKLVNSGTKKKLREILMEEYEIFNQAKCINAIQ